MSRILRLFALRISHRISKATRTAVEEENARLRDTIEQLEAMVQYNEENNHNRVGRIAIDFFSMLVQFGEVLRQQQRRVAVLEALAGERSVQRQTRHQKNQAACACEKMHMPAEVEAGL
jgi:hypothetical protein